MYAVCNWIDMDKCVCVFVRARVCAAMRGGEQHAQRMQRVRGRVSVRGDEEDREQNDREKNGKQP